MKAANAPGNPINTLVWIEAVAVLMSLVADAFYVLAVSPNGARANPGPYLAYAAISAVLAVSVFSIPHAPNRRFALAGVAMIGICALAVLPPQSNSAMVFAAILTARLTFAFGLRGAVLSWIAAFIAIALSVLAQAQGSLTVAELPLIVYSVLSQSTIVGLVFGMIAIIWIYASNNAVAAASAERARIALDLHDSLGHGLTTLSVQLQNAEHLRATDPQKADGYLQRASDTTATLLDDVRETVSVLHDHAQTEAKPLRFLLDRLHADFTSNDDVDLAWNVQLDHEPSGRVAVALYRVLQETLTNISRHAVATRVHVDVRGGEREITLRVEDDGRGFADTPTNGHGLTFMRTRIESVGGTLVVASRTNEGTVVQARVPLEAGA